MHVFKRGGVYWYQVIFEGTRYRRSSKTGNKVLAGRIASAFCAALAKNEVGITERKAAPTFRKAIGEFLAWSAIEHHAHPGTSRRYEISSVALLKHFKDTPLDKITAQDVEHFKKLRLAERSPLTKRKLRPATVNRELACIRAMYNHVRKGHPTLVNPISRDTGVRLLAEDNEQNRVIRFAEQRSYLAAASPTLRDVAGIILETGMRPEEVYTLRDTAIDLDENHLTIIRGKTAAAKRRIQLTGEARRIIEERMERVGPGFLFPGDKDPSRSIFNVNTAHTRAVRVSGVAPFRLYDLRHTWATRAAQSGIDLVTLAAMLGHSRIQMVMRYAHPTQGHQTSAMEMLARHNAAAELKEKAAIRLAEERKAAGKSNLTIIRRQA